MGKFFQKTLKFKIKIRQNFAIKPTEVKKI